MNTVAPEEVGVSSARLSRINKAMKSYIEDGKLADWSDWRNVFRCYEWFWYSIQLLLLPKLEEQGKSGHKFNFGEKVR